MVETSIAQPQENETSASTGQSTAELTDRKPQRVRGRTPQVNRGALSSAPGSGSLITTLLTSISHDLRTPLASILGCATSLSSYSRLLDEATKQELIRTIQDEAELLNRFIGNLLNMTCLQAGELQLRTSPLELSDAIGSALRRAGKVLAAHRTEVRLQPDLLRLDLDAVLFEQVLFNLLDNAAKYAPCGSLVIITAWREDDVVRLQVLDEGPGIPPGDLDRVFEKFFRGDGTVPRCTGTGLGLAICLGFIDAMRGTITAANRSDQQGAVFTVTLPVPTPMDLVKVMVTRSRKMPPDRESRRFPRPGPVGPALPCVRHARSSDSPHETPTR
jgi:K+-sensing histidine kinase KdpD